MSNDPFLDELQNEGLPQDTYETLSADTSFTTADGQVGEWIDADTIQIDGKNIRLGGYNAKEVVQFNDDGSVRKEGEIGGAAQTAVVSQLARDMGYHNLVDTGEVGVFGRPIYDLQNAAGSSFGNELTAAGVVGAGRYTKQQALESEGYEQLYKQALAASGEDATEFQTAADWVDQMINEQGGEFAGFKKVAYDEQELAEAKHAGVGKHYIEDAVQIRNFDRYYDNKAKNPLSTALDTGLQGVVEGGLGFLNLVGETSGWEGLEDWADAKGDRIRYDLSQQPEILLDYKEALQLPDGSWPTSPKQILSRTDEFLEYVGNMAAVSLPYMAVTLGGAALGGVFATAPAIVYAGQTWNEMEGDKSASLAIGAGISMAVLDRLGIRGIANTGVMNAQGRQAIVAQLTARGLTTEQAENQLIQATRLEAAKLSGDAVKFAREQSGVRATIRQLLKGAGIGAGSEGLTEVGQETVGYLAAVAGSDKEYSDAELLDRMVNAAIGGGVLGGAFTVPGTAYNTGAWKDVQHRLAPADAKRRSLQNRWAEQEIKENGRLQSHAEILSEAEAAANRRAQAGQHDENINARAQRDEERRGARGIGQTARELWEGVPGLWRGATRHIFTDELQGRSRAARQIASIFSGQLNQMYSGATFENAKHLKLAEYKNLIDRPTEIITSFGFDGRKIQTKKELKKVSDIIYSAYQATGGDWSKLKDTEFAQYEQAILKFDKEAKRLTDKVFADSKKYNPKLNKLQDYAYRHKSIDKRKVEKDTAGFQQDLEERFGVGKEEAADLVNQIINQNDPFSLTNLGGLKPAAHKGRTLNLSDDAEFSAKWLNDNIFDNLSDVAKTGARYTSYQQFLGENNKILNGKLAEMEQELIESGMDKDEARKATDKAARGMRDYLDAESGNYKRPKTETGRWLQAAQKDFMFITTLASLPLATLSSMVEFALAYRALEGPQIKEMNDIALKEAKSMVNNFWSEKDFETVGRQQLRDLGFFEWEVGAATVTGATEISASKQQWSEAYFKAIGLKQWTDYTRAMRGAIAQDYVTAKLDILAHQQSEIQTNEEAEAEEALRNLGINVQDMLEIYQTPEANLTEEQAANRDQMMRDSTFQFINDAVVLPQAALRPLFYQDPRFALFTQFHGFISTFQANHLPKLYRQAFKGGTPAMKYNAFAVMASMILLGFLSQYLKDLLKYGQSTPYLTETGELIQRGVGASGLLGTTERVLNIVNPIYDTRYDSSAEWAFDTLTGESAAISKGKEVVGAAGEFLSGDPNRGTRKALKFAPFLGPFTGLRNETANWLFDEE